MRSTVIMLILFLVVACSGESPRNNLLGEWVWVKSSGGIAGMEYTPQSTGESRELKLTADSLIFFTNGDRDYGLAYSLELRESIFSEEKTLQLVTNALNYSVELQGSTLFLAEECYDCFINEYSRGSE